MKIHLMKIDAKAETSATGEAMDAYLLLVAGSHDPPEMTVFTVVIAVISQLPVGIDIQIVSQSAKEPDLQNAQPEGVPEYPGAGFDAQPGPAESQRCVYLGSQLLVFRRQIPVQRDDIPVQTRSAAYE